MTNEDRQRTMEFILEQQAQIAVHIQQLEEERIRDRPRLVRLEESFLQLVELNKTVDYRLDTSEAESSRLEDALVRFTETNDSRLNRLESRATRLEDSFQLLVRLAEVSETRLEKLESRANR
ncbi:MAG TPA: hypothetical protein VFY34_01265 [Pyrinomonadaceae bacterium]|nr:hypothetical protein [Pyrinomonadaceae bacterium]